jgi:hypothetical protein
LPANVAKPDIPSTVDDRGSNTRFRIAAPTGSQPGVPVEVDEDAPESRSGVVTAGLEQASASLSEVVSRRVRRNRGAGDGAPPGKQPMWVVVLVAMIGGGGGGVGLDELIGPDPELAALTARVDAQDEARESLAARMGTAERAIAEAEVTRVTEVRHLIKLNQVVLTKLGVADEDMPDLPPELSERYRDIEVEATRRKLFPGAAAPKDPGTIPTP